MAEPNIADVTVKLFKLLEPLDAEMRKRALAGVLGMLGDQIPLSAGGKKQVVEEVDGDYPAKATAWMRQNSVSAEQLAHVFHDADLIANNIPGSNKREKTLNTYILTGIGHLVSNGEARFDDNSAREACEQHGCYDANNHSGTINKKRGNAFTGSKKTGWQLTVPGLKTGAELVKQIAQG